MARKKRELGNDTYFTIFNSDLRLIKDPVKKILYSKIKNWVLRNEDKESCYHFKDGQYWTFGSYEYWANECGIDIKTSGKHLRGLVQSGILKKGNYNRMKSDKTIWYRIANNEELKYVNFRLLHYGTSKKKNCDFHSNETLLQMYLNGMMEVTKRDDEEEQLGSPLPEYITEHRSEHTLEKSLEDSLKKSLGNFLENSSKDTLVIIEEYNNLKDNIEITNHIEHLSKINIEDISTDMIKSFLDKFHVYKIDSIENETYLQSYKYRIDGLFDNYLNEMQLEFLKALVNKYYYLIISPQPAEQKIDEVNPMSA